MDLLSQLLHKLVDHAVPAGNARADAHVLADDAIAELGGYARAELADVDDDAAPAGESPAPAVPAAKFATPKTAANGAAAPA